MKKTLFLILLIGLVLLSSNLFADTSSDKEEIDCMGVVMPFSQEGAVNNIILEYSSMPCALVNLKSSYFVQYSNSQGNNNLNIYNLPVLYNFPGIGNNVTADTKIMCANDTCYHMRC